MGLGYEVFVLMEYCSGHGLLDFMNAHLRDLLSETQILQIACDIASGLAYMHYQDPPLIHRDLKIENVLISGDGVFKLCDFGSASPVLRPPRNAQEYQILENDIQNRTTMQYRSPEMVDLTRGFPIDEKSDIWAFGVFVYKLCYYTTPFEKEGDPAILSAKYTFPPKPAFSERLKRLIRVSLSEDPRNRPNIYQIHKEICDMRGTQTDLQNIYVSPTSTQRISSAEPSLANSKPNSGLTATTPSKSAAPQLLQPNAQPKAAQPPPQASQALKLSSVTPPAQQSSKPETGNAKITSAATAYLATAQQGTATPKEPATTTPKPSSSSSKSPVDPFLIQDDDDVDIDKLNAEDIESKYPTIEELTMNLEQQSFGSSSPTKPAQPKTYTSSNLNLTPSISYPYSNNDGVFTNAPTIAPVYSVTSPWTIPQTSNPSPGQSLSTTPSAATTLAGSFSTTLQTPASNSLLYTSYDQKFSQLQPNVQPASQKIYKSQTQPSQAQTYKPNMVSHSTMTSPVASRSHTPAVVSNVQTAIAQQQPVNPHVINQDAAVGTSRSSTPSSSSDDDPLADDGYYASTTLKYKSQTPVSETPYTQQLSKPKSVGNNLGVPSGRSSEERPSTRPVSMYISGSDSINDSNDFTSKQVNLQPKVSHPTTISQPKPQSALLQPEVVLIEPIDTEEKDRLKSLLTGLSEKSSTMILDSNESYIDNGVDFLKSLNRESTGRSRHSRSPSASSIHEESLQPPPSNRKSSFHNKKSSVSLKHAVSSKIGDAFKKFDGSNKRLETKSAPLSNLKKNKFSYSTESLGTYDDYNQDEDFSNYRNSGMTRHTSVRVPSSTQRGGGYGGNGSVHNRIQALMNPRNEPPPKTATGYGKYTDRNWEENIMNDEENTASTIQPIRSYTSIPNQYQRGRTSLDIPRSDQRRSVDFSYNRTTPKDEKKSKIMITSPSSVSSISSSPAPGRHHIPHPHLPHHRFSRNKSSKNNYNDDFIRYRDEVSDSSGDEDEQGNYIPSNRIDLRDQTLKAPPEFHAHKRQLSTISSASSSTEGSSYLGLPKRPPNKPIKPAHLKSPRRADSDISDTGSTVSPAYNKSSSASTPALGSSNPAINKLRSDMEKAGATTTSRFNTDSTSRSNNSNLIDITPGQSPISSTNEDWKDVFNHKYPNLV